MSVFADSIVDSEQSLALESMLWAIQAALSSSVPIRFCLVTQNTYSDTNVMSINQATAIGLSSQECASYRASHAKTFVCMSGRYCDECFVLICILQCLSSSACEAQKWQQELHNTALSYFLSAQQQAAQQSLFSTRRGHDSHAMKAFSVLIFCEEFGNMTATHIADLRGTLIVSLSTSLDFKCEACQI